MKSTHRLLLLAALVFAAAPMAHAEFEWGAKYAGDYISGQSNARLLALGGAGVAFAEGPAAVMANPAGIFTSHGNAVSLMHADRFSSMVKVDHAAYVRREEHGRALGFGLVRQGVDDIPVTRLRDPSQPIGPSNRVVSEQSTSASEYAFFLATALDKPYGRIGGTAKLLYKRLYHSDAYGLGVDLGYRRDFGHLAVGAQLRDALTTLLAWNTGRQEGIAPTFRVGAAYTLPLERMKAEVMPVVEFETRTESLGNPDAYALHAGLEYRIRKIVAARIGIDDHRLTYGAGVNVGPLSLNYAFVGHEDLGATHRISLSYRWGRSL